MIVRLRRDQRLGEVLDVGQRDRLVAGRRGARGEFIDRGGSVPEGVFAVGVEDGAHRNPCADSPARAAGRAPLTRHRAMFRC